MIYPYYLLTLDCLQGLLIFTPHNCYVFDAMMTFGNYNHNLMLGFAALGSLIAVILNWLVGYTLILIGKTRYIHNNYDNYQRLQTLYQKYYVILLCLTFIPVLGAFITLLCGFFRVSWAQTLLIAGISNFLYFCFILISA